MKQSKYTTYDELPLMLSAPEVASVLGISRAGAYDLARSRGFPSLTIGTRIVVPKDKFIAWVEQKVSENFSEFRAFSSFPCGFMVCVLANERGDFTWQNAEQTEKAISENAPMDAGKDAIRRDAIPKPAR